MRPRRFLPLAALVAFVVLGLQYTAVGQGVSTAVSTFLYGSTRAQAMVLIDSVTGVPVVYAGDPSGATGSAVPARANYFGGVTSGALGGLLTGITVSDSGGWLDMTTATTTEIAPLVASRTIRVGAILVTANGATTVTFKRGTGTNCGTGTTSVSPAHELTAQTGWQEGNGIGEVIGPAGAGTVGGAMTAGNALCVTSSAAVNVHVKIRYAVF